MKVKSKGLLKAENEYLKRTLLFTINCLKLMKLDPFVSEIIRAERKITEYHKILIGNYLMWYDLEKLIDSNNMSIAHEINDEINKQNI